MKLLLYILFYIFFIIKYTVMHESSEVQHEVSNTKVMEFPGDSFIFWRILLAIKKKIKKKYIYI